MRYSEELVRAIRAMFMLEAIEFINKEADKGLECRDYELSDGEDKVIYKIPLERVGRAETLIHLIENEYKDIDYFNYNEYEFKRNKGIVSRFTCISSSYNKLSQIKKPNNSRLPTFLAFQKALL